MQFRFCYAMPRSAVTRCLSVTFVDCQKNKDICNFFSPSGSHTTPFWFFHTKRHGNMLTRTSLTAPSNAGGVGTHRDSRRIAGYRSMNAAARTTTATVDRAVYRTHQHASVSESMFITTRMDDHDEKKRTEHNLFVCRSTSEAE